MDNVVEICAASSPISANRRMINGAGSDHASISGMNHCLSNGRMLNISR